MQACRSHVGESKISIQTLRRLINDVYVGPCNRYANIETLLSAFMTPQMRLNDTWRIAADGELKIVYNSAKLNCLRSLGTSYLAFSLKTLTIWRHASLFHRATIAMLNSAYLETSDTVIALIIPK